MLKRHIDHGIYLSDFTYRDQWVKCPQCNQAAILKFNVLQTVQQSLYKGTFSLSCLYCAYQIKPCADNHAIHHNGHYYASASQRCQHCGGTWVNTKQKLNNSGLCPPYIQGKCNLCNHVSIFKQYEITFILDQPIGYTRYGLELYLKTQTRQGEIFVFNPEHLKELKDYIQADLRERTQQTGNGSYFSRLPAWIKSARNREEVLKAILRLEQMASSIQPLTNK